VISQARQHAGWVHFPFPHLQAAFHRGLNSALGLGVSSKFHKEFGVSTEICSRREGDCIHPLPLRNQTGGWKFGDSVCKSGYESAEHAGGQRSIDPTVALGQISVVIVAAQNGLKRAGASHEARQVLYTPAPGIRPNATSG
jgi:hypothetical protein